MFTPKSQITAFIFLTTALGFPMAWSSNSHNHDHHDKHVHGEATIEISIDEGWKTGEIEMNFPGMDLLGFERAAKNPKEKEKVDSVIKNLAESLSPAFKFGTTPQCQLTLVQPPKFDIDNEHADFDVELKIKCQSSLENSELSFSPPQFLSAFKKYEVTVIAPLVQSSKSWGKKGGSLIFK